MSSITKSRILGIDALRGIAAFLVLLFHVFGSGTLYALDRWRPDAVVQNIAQIVPAYGYCGVYLFFVISGFCIHLRWAKVFANDPTSHLDVGFLQFWKRRWIRLYPAYMAAIILYLVWLQYNGRLSVDGFFAWDMISHVLMIHNLDGRTVFSMNGVFWTLAIEEQLYLLYFILLMLRKRFGWAITLSICISMRFVWLVISFAVTRYGGFELPFNEGSLANWWIWAMGAYAVESYFGIKRLPEWCYSLSLSGLFLLLAAMAHFAMQAYPAVKAATWTAMAFEPLLWGAGFFFLINRATRRDKAAATVGWRHFVVAKWAFIGIFSYSLYLVHEVVIGVMNGRNAWLVTAVSLVFAYLFFLIFERPFMLYLARDKDRHSQLSRFGQEVAPDGA